jgi:hypothetical protein
MRYKLVASALLIPSLFTAVAVASQPKDDSSVPTEVQRVSTGVTYPSLLKTAHVSLAYSDSHSQTIPKDAAVVLDLNIGKDGKAQNIAIVNSVSADLDQRVIDAVRQFRWHPAMLDQQPVPMDLTLKVVVQPETQQQ